jgi:tRNA nucleotidyltransferase (CCA-adding enzyme)
VAIKRIPKSIETISTIYEEKVSRAVRQRQTNKINRESLRLITNINHDMRDRIGELLREGVVEGRSVSATASTLLKTGLDKGIFRSARKRAFLIARTELHRARQSAAIDLYEANGIKLVKWASIADGRICGYCLKMANKILRLSDIKEKGLYPPIHPRCRCRIIPSELQLNIEVKHGREGKVLETKIAPNPKDYKYIISVDKSLEKSQVPIRQYIRIRRGKYETVKPYLRTKEDMRKELTADAAEAAKKYGVSVKDLEYSGLQSFEPFLNHYMHLWTIMGPEDHKSYQSTITSGKKYDIKKSNLEKARPYIRTRRGKFEHVRGYVGRTAEVVFHGTSADKMYSILFGGVQPQRHHNFEDSYYGYGDRDKRVFAATGGKGLWNATIFATAAEKMTGKPAIIIEAKIPKNYFRKNAKEDLELLDEPGVTLPEIKPEWITNVYDKDGKVATETIDSLRLERFIKSRYEIVYIPLSFDILKEIIEHEKDELEKARPYIRTRRGRFEHVKGYIGKVSETKFLSIGTPEFKEWFEGSVVIDSEGKPAVMYHTSKSADVTEFFPLSHFGTKEQALSLFEGRRGRGETPSVASYPVYLSIKNPLRIEDRMSNSVQSLLEQIDPELSRKINKEITEVHKKMTDEDNLKWSKKVKEWEKRKAWKLGEPRPGPKSWDWDEFTRQYQFQRDIVIPRKYIPLLINSVEVRGYDGLVYKNLGESDTEDTQKIDPEKQKDSYVIFHPHQVKSKFNIGSWSKTDPDIIKARPYIRTRRGRFEHVKGYPHKPRLFDVPFEKRISQAWDTSREDVRVANRVVHEIQAIGGRALIVGGFVRDALMGKKSKDIDIEVYGVRPDKLRSALDRIGTVNDVGVSFGVLKLKTPELDEPLDVSIPRRDNKVGPGHKGFNVEADPTMTTKEAARRRDLTINALSYDPITKEIIDDFGGVQDIKDRVIRVVDPETFVEDPLRVLRVMQFAGRFEFSPDVKTALVCGQVNLEELPKERVYGELEKLLLKSRMPSIGIRLIPMLGINKIMPELDALRGVPQDPKYHLEGSTWQHTLLSIDAAAKLRDKFSDKKDKMIYMLAALLHDIGKPSTTEETSEGRIISHGHAEEGAKVARQFLERLTDEIDILEGVETLVHYHMRPTELYEGKASDSAIRRLARKVDIPMLVALSMADKMGRTDKADLKAERWLMKRYKDLKLADPETLDRRVKGRHLIQLGIQPGPEMGRILNKIYSAQLEGKFDTTEEGVKYATDQGWILKGFFSADLNKAISVKGFTRTRKGKFERVEPYSRKSAFKMSEEEIKDKLVSGDVDDLNARIIHRSVGSTEAVIEINGRRFTIDNSNRLKLAGIKTDYTTRTSKFRGTTGELSDWYRSYPKLGRYDFPKVSRKTSEEVKELKDEFEEKTSLLHTTYDRLASPPKTEKERQEELKRKKVDPETEAVLRRLFAKSLREFIGKPNTEENIKEIKDLILKAVQVKGFLRTRRGKSEWVRPHHREADEIRRKIPEVKVKEPFVAKTEGASTEFDKATNGDFRISMRDGSNIIGYVDGEIFSADVKEPRKGIGTSLFIDALRLLVSRENELVTMRVAGTEAGKATVSKLVREGYISEPIEIKPSGTTIHRILIDAEGNKIKGKVPEVSVRFEDAKGEKISANRLAEYIDKNTYGAHLDVRSIKEALNKESSVWVKISVEISKLKRIDDPDINLDAVFENKGAIVVGKDGTIYDGRHRAAKARKQGKKEIDAYVPIIEKTEHFFLDPKKAIKSLVSLRKSRNIGKRIPYRLKKGEMVWASVTNKGLLLKGSRKVVNIGDNVLLKSETARITAIGKDGITARSEVGKKIQAFYKDTKLLLKK